MAGKDAVTLKDKKKAKTTCKLFATLSVLFLAGVALSAIFTPRANVIKGINGDEGETIRTFTAGPNDQYYAVSPAKMQRANIASNEVVETLDYVAEITAQVNDPRFVTTVFDAPIMHFEQTGEDEGYLLIFDDDGDIFKYDYLNGKTTLSEDYWMTPRVTLKDTLYKAKYKTHAVDVKEKDGTTYLYVETAVNNSYTVNVFDVDHLSEGIKKSKGLLAFVEPDKDQKIEYGKDVYIVDPVDSSKGETPYNAGVTDDYYYIFTSGGVHRWSLDFADFSDSSDHLVSLSNDGATYFTEAMRSDLLDDSIVSAETKSEYGISDTQISEAAPFVIQQMYKVILGDNAYATKEVESAKEYRLENSDWIVKYDPTMATESFVIKKDVVDAAHNLNVNVNAEQTLGGIAYAKSNESIYYLDLKSDILFSLRLNLLNDFQFEDSRTLSDVSTNTGISYHGASFYSSRSNIVYARNSDSLHVTFYSSRDISVIDLKEEKPYVRYTISYEYDVRGFLETLDGSSLAVMFQTEKRTLNNVASFPLHIGVISPDTYQYHTLFVVLFVISLVLCIVSLIVFALALRSYRNSMTMVKMKVIHRDLRRHKWTYVALIPFIVLLILFCWVEAIGSISFSFFSYTMQKPSYIWNDFGNYIEIFNDNKFWLMFGNTAFFLVFDLFLGLVPPIIFAFCLSIIKNQKLSGVLRALMFIPAIVPGIATLLIWKVGIFGDSGVLNQIICFFQTGSTSTPGYTPINFLHDEDISRWSLLLMGFPYVGGYLIFYGGIMNIPKEYDEACQLEGVGVVKRFFTIDLPLIKPQIKYILVMGILSSVQNYERTYMLGSSGTTTLVESMYRQMKDVANPNYGLASAYATILFLLLLFPVMWNFRNTRKNTMGDSL